MHTHGHNTHTHTHMRTHTHTHAQKGTAKQRMLTQSSCVWRGWYRLVFSLHSSLTLTHSLASTLSQTCWTAAFAWRCHSSPCGSDVRRKKKTKNLKALIRNAFISSKGSLFLFFHLSTSSVAVSQLFDIFPEENVLSCNKPVVSRSSPHLTLLFPPPFFPNQ